MNAMPSAFEIMAESALIYLSAVGSNSLSETSTMIPATPASNSCTASSVM